MTTLIEVLKTISTIPTGLFYGLMSERDMEKAKRGSVYKKVIEKKSDEHIKRYYGQDDKLMVEDERLHFDRTPDTSLGKKELHEGYVPHFRTTRTYVIGSDGQGRLEEFLTEQLTYGGERRIVFNPAGRIIGERR